MSNFVVNGFCTLEKLIGLIKEKKDRGAVYMIYIRESVNELQSDMEVYVGDVPDFDDDENEILPQSVTALGLEQGYMREHFQDVVDLAYKQKPAASVDEVVRCLNHYAQYDDFLDLN